MDALSVALLLLVEECVLVPRKHFLLAGHLCKPAVHSLGGLSIALKGSTDSVNDAVHRAQALALPCLLGRGETPRGLPVVRENG